MGLRPAGRVPVLGSTGGNYPAYDSSKLWHGTARNVDPGSVKEGVGFEPEEDVPAPYVNWLLRQLGAHLARLDAIEVCNFTTESVIDDPNRNFFDIAHDPYERRVYVAGEDTAVDADIQWSVGGQVDWTSVAGSLSSPPNEIVAICYYPEALCMWAAGGATKYSHLSGNGTTWSGYNAANIVAQACLEYDPYAGVIWNGCTKTGPVPGLDRVNSAVGAGTTGVTLTGVTGTSPISDVACGPSKRVALMRHASAAHLWGSATADGLAAWSHLTTAPFLAMNPRGVAYSEADDLFLVPCANGKLYGSSIGVTNTWTLIAELATLTPVACTFGGGGIVARGSLWIADVLVGGALGCLGVSRDRGTTWQLVERPVTGSIQKMRANVDNRLAILRAPAAGATSVAYGLRLLY